MYDFGNKLEDDRDYSNSKNLYYDKSAKEKSVNEMYIQENHIQKSKQKISMANEMCKDASTSPIKTDKHNGDWPIDCSRTDRDVYNEYYADKSSKNNLNFRESWTTLQKCRLILHIKIKSILTLNFKICINQYFR